MRTFRTKLLVMMALLLGACVGFIQLYFPSYFHAQAEQALADRARALAHLLSSSLRPALDFDDRQAAERRLAELAAVSEAEAAVLRAADGDAFGAWSRSAAAASALETSSVEGFTASRRHYVVHLDIAGRAAAGTLNVLFSTDAVARQRQHSAGVVRIASLGVLGFGLLAALLFGSMLMRPIARVTDVARRISGGDVKARDAIDVGRKDELGVMARALSDMVGRLLRERALLASQLECSSEGILVAGRSGEVLAHNHPFREMWKLGAAELARLKLPELLRHLREQTDADVPLLQRADDFTSGRLDPFKLRDGRVLSAYRAPIAGDDGAPFALAYYFRDVTELRTAQEQLVLADRRSSVGRLAAGVAHEVNNPLTFIIANVSFCIEQLHELTAAPREAVDTMIEALDDIKGGAERVAYIVRSLTALSRGDEGERERLDVVECLEKTLTIASPEIRHRATVTRHFELAHAYVDASSVRLGQVFLNLLINAAKAIAAGTTGHIKLEVLPGPAGTVDVKISDDGCGMSDEVKSRLFTPFFTTREVGSGTGLGLSISLSIARSYGGDIVVDSQAGRGSTFTVRLPLAEGQGEGPRAPVEAEELPARKLKLLLVDDEPQVGRSVSRTLIGQHEVLVFQKPEDAIARLEGGGHFDVMLTDLHMPGMTGAELHDVVTRLDPALAANTLFMSGGAVTEEIKAFALAHERRLFPKPIDAKRLRRALAVFSREGSFDA